MGTEEKMDNRERLYVLYDGTCNLGLASVKRLKGLRSSADLRFASVQSLEESPGLVPIPLNLTREQLLTKLHVVEPSGACYAGADGIVRILRTVGGLRLLAPLYRIPGMRKAADALYRYIAARRYDWFGKADEGCANGACSLTDRDKA